MCTATLNSCRKKQQAQVAGNLDNATTLEILYHSIDLYSQRRISATERLKFVVSLGETTNFKSSLCQVEVKGERRKSLRMDKDSALNQA